MFKTRRYNKNAGTVEIWTYEWIRKQGVSRKRYIEKVGDDDEPAVLDLAPGRAVCWSFDGTMGNIAVDSASVLGQFEEDEGSDAQLPCSIIKAGKFRHGAPRWYCRTHMVYWGTKADKESYDEGGDIVCSNASMRFSYVKNPLEIDFNVYEEVGIWCSLPAALSSREHGERPPRVHVHAREKGSKTKVIDGDYSAILCVNPEAEGLFESHEITRIQITPPAIFDFMTALIKNNASDLGCVSCNKCHFPHLDLGMFAAEPHKKHFCANCGNDSTWTNPPMISNPLTVLHDHFKYGNKYEPVKRKINIDDYGDGVDFDIWASTPAIVWTGDRPQEEGIHVHIYKDGNLVVDDTYGEVVLEGEPLAREHLLEKMICNTRR